ncbi:MAG: protein kinase [Vicinamibacterales bacterium]|jgi:hypothetical protein|nr:protein kinase [Vicinamibacterales bacterium]
MPLTPGTALGPYSVTAKIGEGGMGEVYRARDTKLDRDVALKVLPEAFTSDPDRLARFEREAKVLASLNHPNIASIYGLEDSGDTKALVLELVEGPTLADRIAQSVLPVDDALALARQIADALEAAHEQGVIHRDLKPANIKVREDGTVKVLDFGLAKAFQPDAAADPSQSMSPTISLTAAATQMGMIIGTAAYMAPEQAKGKTVDKRADVWAFGCVLYEMLTGHRPFAGDDVSDTLAAVLRAEIDWSALPIDVPSSVVRLLQRCLERDVRRRLRDIGEARFTFDELSTAAIAIPQQPVPVAMPQRTTRDRLIGAVVGTIIGGLLVAAALTRGSFGRPDSGQSGNAMTRRFTMTMSALRATANGGIAISPDGQRLVVSGRNHDGSLGLFERPMNGFEMQPIRGTERGSLPFFSPDGRSVGFQSGTELNRVSLDGGIPVTVAELPTERIPGIAWTDSGTWILGQREGPLVTMPDSGGPSQPLTRLLDGERGHQFPHLLPGGAGLLFTVTLSGDETQHVAVRGPDADEHQLLFPGSSPVLVASGHLVFNREFTLWAAPFDAERLTVLTDPVPVVDGVNSRIGGWAGFSTAPDGTLIYETRDTLRSSVVWFERDGTTTPIGDDEPTIHHGLALSPDERTLAVTRHLESGDDQVMLYDLERGTSRVLVTGMDSRWPLWGGDTGLLTFASTRGGSWDIYDVALDSAAEPEPLVALDGLQIPESWSPDRQTLLFGSDERGRTWIRRADTEPRLLDEQRRLGPAIAPTGEWLAYASAETGQEEVYLQSWPALGRPALVSTDRGVNPRWSADGRTLYYQRDDGVYAVSVGPGPEPDIGLPERIAAARPPSITESSFDVTADGRVVALLAEQDVGEATLNVVLNWFEELKERVPVP